MNASMRELFDWLVDGAPGSSTAPQVVERLGNTLVELGMPVTRIAAFVRTLHPHVMGRSFHWRPGTPVEINEASHAMLGTPTFLASPVALVFESGQVLRRRIARGETSGYAVLEELAKEGVTDYVAIPLKFMNGEVHAITFATAQPEGFLDDHVRALIELCRPLSRIAEIMALSRTAVNLLNTYVGRNAGERILQGHILRGDTDDIRCVIWFSDLRGFTKMSDTVAPSVLIRTLNELFDCQVPAIERHGGEVLKFMGDGTLAIFPIGQEGAVPICRSAVQAASEAFAALERLNELRRDRGESSLRFGIALHTGDVAYGNIGGENRLDFTCIGPAVNLAARIESLASRLGRPILLSAEFARHLGSLVVSLGEHELKGVRQPQAVYELAAAEAPVGGPLPDL